MRNEIKFNHSGNFGDIIYSLPFCIASARDLEYDKFSMNLQTNVGAKYINCTHPLGNIRMNMDVARSIEKLLSIQPYIRKITISDKCPNDSYNLDKFRDLNYIHLACGSISQWYNMLSFTMVNPPNLANQWIWSDRRPFALGDKRIILFRSSRYHRKDLNYTFLKKYAKEILFIGLEEEKRAFESQFFKVDFYKVKDFLEVARIFASAKLIIGNQTGLFSIAEAMKVPRLLETAYECPNVVMMGGSFQYIVHWKQFVEVLDVFYRRFVAK